MWQWKWHKATRMQGICRVATQGERQNKRTANTCSLQPYRAQPPNKHRVLRHIPARVEGRQHCNMAGSAACTCNSSVCPIHWRSHPLWEWRSISADENTSTTFVYVHLFSYQQQQSGSTTTAISWIWLTFATLLHLKLVDFWILTRH